MSKELLSALSIQLQGKRFQTTNTAVQAQESRADSMLPSRYLQVSVNESIDLGHALVIDASQDGYEEDHH